MITINSKLTHTTSYIEINQNTDIPYQTDPISREEFYSEVKFFSCYEKTPEQIADELFKNIPRNLNLTELVDFIFTKCIPSNISPLLNALLISHPSFTLSPYDKTRQAILEDKGHSLTNDLLDCRLKEHNILDKIAGCYDLAYRMNHPYIYQRSENTVQTHDYSLNFLWINLNPQNRIDDLAQNIFKDGLDLSENANCIKDPRSLRTFEENEKTLEKDESDDWEKIKESFTYRISKWADVNPGAEINLWYDSALVTEKASQNTSEMMKNISESRGVTLKLRDIRDLPNMDSEITSCLHPATPIYFRVDLLKALIADQMMSSSEENAKFCVVSDIDIEPMSSEQMFDQRTQDYLSTKGYVFNRVGLGDFENSFFIFNKEKERIQKIHNEALIEETSFKVKHLRNYSIDTPLKHNFILDGQAVFSLYSDFKQGMGERRETAPRKVVNCPPSQFLHAGNFLKSDYKSETFRFIGKSNIPYVKNGRNRHRSGEAQIPSLLDWKPEPIKKTLALG